MLGLANDVRIGNRLLVVILAIGAILGLSVLVPAAARASGCTDSWTNTAGGSWFTGSNWSNGTAPTSKDEACITANGTYTVTMTQSSETVSVRSLTVGGTSGMQTLAVGSSCSVNAVLTTTAGITNGSDGAITLTNGDTCGNSVTVVGPISNAGAITSEPAIGGSRSLQGELTNTGTLAINTNTAYNGEGTYLLNNKGAINVAAGKELTVSGKDSLTNAAGGSINALGSGDVLISDTKFTENAGKTSGTKPVIVNDGVLSYTSTGKSLITLYGSDSLTGSLGAAQSLSIESTCGENAAVTAAASFTNAGAITMSNDETCGNSDTLTLTAGTLTNSGTITTEVANGGARTLQGNIKNTGKLAINQNTSYNGEDALLTNEGAIDVSEAIELTVSNGGSLANGAGGKIVATGDGDVVMASGTSFSEGAGTTSGTKPVTVDDGTLNYTGTGKSLITLYGSDSLTGSLGAAQSLSIESTCGENAAVTAAASFTNAGAITMSNDETCGNSDTLTLTAGTLTNSGTITTEVANGGARTLQGNIKNTGKLAINQNTSYNGEDALLTNEGEVSLLEGTQLDVSNGGSFTNGAGGKISATGDAAVSLSSGTTFTEGGGTITGAKPVIVDDGTLSYTGAGTGLISLRGSDALSGSLVAGQLLSIESTCGENATVTAAASFTNAGTITLTNAETCGNNATLAVSAGTLTNSGRINAEPADGGSRTLQGNFTNASAGTLTIRTKTAYNGSDPVLINEGTINISEGSQLAVSDDAAVTNGAGGKIDGTGSGSLFQSGGTFTEGAGAVVGSIEPVVLDDGTLVYTGTSTEHGSGRIELRGADTLTGDVRTEETLAIASTCGENATVSTSSFYSAGTLELTDAESCGNSDTINLKGGKFTNTGKLKVDNVHGGRRSIEGSLIDGSLLSISAGETLDVSGTYTQGSGGSFKTAIAGESEFGALSVAGAATLAGTLKLSQVPPFKASAGQTYAILNAASLTGTFATETGDEVNSTGLYYRPTYSATGVTLVVTQSTLSVSAHNGPPGSSVTLTGTGYTPGDTVTPTFTDHKGVETTYPSVKVNSSGEYSTEITIPASAAPGDGTIKVTSTETGTHVNTSFDVT
jgi:fibronectin-binding autotransporter adhesin